MVSQESRVRFSSVCWCVCVCQSVFFLNVFLWYIYIYIQYVCYIYTYVYIFIEIISVSISLCAFIFWSVFLNLSTFLCCFLYLPSAYQYLSTPSLRPSIYPLPIYLLFFFLPLTRLTTAYTVVNGHVQAQAPETDASPCWKHSNLCWTAMCRCSHNSCSDPKNGWQRSIF